MIWKKLDSCLRRFLAFALPCPGAVTCAPCSSFQGTQRPFSACLCQASIRHRIVCFLPTHDYRCNVEILE